MLNTNSLNIYNWSEQGMYTVDVFVQVPIRLEKSPFFNNHHANMLVSQAYFRGYGTV